MDKETRKELKARSLELESVVREDGILDKLRDRLTRLYRQRYEVIDGRRVKLSKPRKIAKGNALIDKMLPTDKPIDITQDAINTVTVLEDRE